eukprot:7703562-Karenia_brevis.AAC.1
MKSDVPGMIPEFGNNWGTTKLGSTYARPVATILVPRDCSSGFVCMMSHRMTAVVNLSAWCVIRCMKSDVQGMIPDFGINWRTAKLSSTDA